MPPTLVVVWLSVGCSGVLLSGDVVLYAAHCSEHVDLVELPTGAWIATTHCEVHPEARTATGTDAAFCLLAAADLVPVPVGIGESDRVEGGLMGYGFGSPVGVGQLGPFDATFLGMTPYGALVTEVAPFAACGGDSGGPLVNQQGEIVGILSAAQGQCNAVESAARYAYYAPVAPLLPWLKERIGLLEAASRQSSAHGSSHLERAP